MKNFWNIASPVLNIVLFAILQMMAVFMFVQICGDSAAGDKYAWLASLAFVLIQVLINIWLYCKRKLITNKYALWISIAIVILLFLNFTVFPGMEA